MHPVAYPEESAYQGTWWALEIGPKATQLIVDQAGVQLYV